MIERADPAIARELILEYAASTGVDLSFQNLSDEIAALDTFYEAIFVADETAGCVALRKIDNETCEMKRLYVRPQFRGRNIGRDLVARVIEEARTRGYKRMRLDTLPTMTAAMELYRSFGFVEIAPYRHNPVEASKYMELTIAP